MNGSPLPARRVAGYARVLLLVGIAGYVDAFGLLNFQTFVSFMSGNTTTAGLEIDLASAGAAVPPLFAVVFFVVGVFLGALIAVANPVRAQQLCFALVAALIAAFMIAARGGGLNNLVSIATLSLAMGLLNTTVSRIGVEPVNVGYVSGTLSKMRSWYRSPHSSPSRSGTFVEFQRLDRDQETHDSASFGWRVPIGYTLPSNTL
jgi:uncharacterized membrane protein YoaK (UPF0700 family)